MEKFVKLSFLVSLLQTYFWHLLHKVAHLVHISTPQILQLSFLHALHILLVHFLHWEMQSLHAKCPFSQRIISLTSYIHESQFNLDNSFFIG